MAVQLPSSIFYHIPKTGGTWVRKAIEPITVCEVGPKDVDYAAVFHCSPSSFLSNNNLISFTFIRHPYTWYQSLFRHNTKHGWFPKVEFNKAESNNFRDFVFKSSETNKGGLSKWYKGYTKKIDFICRYENLQEDLILVLNIAGEEFSEKYIRECTAVNMGDSSIEAELTQEVKEVIYQSEKESFEMFGYKL